MEMDKTYFDEIGAHNCPIVCGELGSTDKQKLNHWGSVSPGRCETKGGKGRGGSNGGIQERF